MNRLVRIALLLAATLSVTMPAQALQDVRGWRNTTWNMSESEVKRSVAALGLVVTPVSTSPSPGLPAEVPFKTRVEIEGSEYDVAFHFLDDTRQLDRVQVGGQDVPREEALRRHASLLRMLTDRLGAPTDTDSRGALLSMTRWTFKTTTIALNMYTDTGARDRSTQVAVTYSPTAQRAEDRGKVLGFGLLQFLGGFWKR
jgi:hypothetical protein